MKITLYEDNYCCIEYDTQENQKLKLKLKNKILKSIIYFTSFLFLLSACMLDSDSYIPYVILVACTVILIVFMIANWDIISKYDIRR